MACRWNVMHVYIVTYIYIYIYAWMHTTFVLLCSHSLLTIEFDLLLLWMMGIDAFYLDQDFGKYVSYWKKVLKECCCCIHIVNSSRHSVFHDSWKSHRQMRHIGTQLLLLASFDFWLHYGVALQWAIAACGDEWWVGGALPSAGVRGGTKILRELNWMCQGFCKGSSESHRECIILQHAQFVFWNHFSL